MRISSTSALSSLVLALMAGLALAPRPAAAGALQLGALPAPAAEAARAPVTESVQYRPGWGGPGWGGGWRGGPGWGGPGWGWRGGWGPPPPPAWGWRAGGWGPGPYWGGYYGYGPGWGFAPGFATGVIVGSAVAVPPPPPPPANWYAYCASKYRSFDPRTGTYMGYDGRRHPCT